MQSVDVSQIRLRIYPDTVVRNPALTHVEWVVDSNIHSEEWVEESPKLHTSVQRLIDKMIDICEGAEGGRRGVGLAANQAGISVNLFVAKVKFQPGLLEHRGFTVFVNPHIVSSWGSQKNKEGCLSLPYVNVKVERAYGVELEFNSPDKRRHQMKFEGADAQVIQHEMDHLNGILITDKAKGMDALHAEKQLKALENRVS